MNTQQTVVVPWYRVPTVWLVVALPAAAVIAGFVTLWLAVRSDDGLVVDDYYRRGKEINLDLARDRAAAAQGFDAQLQIDAQQKEISVKFSPAKQSPPQMEITFSHATRQGYDRRLVLPRMQDGDYRAPLPALASGRYHVQLSAGNWRLVGSLHVPGDGRLRLAPAVLR